MKIFPKITAVFVAGLLTLPASALASSGKTYTASSGDVRATVTVEQDEGSIFAGGDINIKIFNGGRLAVNDTIKNLNLSSLTKNVNGSPLQVRNIDFDPDPEVILGLFRPGASGCCMFIRVYDSDGNGNYNMMQKNFGHEVVMRKLDKDDLFEFVSSDTRFYNRYAPAASRYQPIRIFNLYDMGKPWGEVTNHFPKQVAADAKKALKAANRECKRRGKFKNTMGYYAAYAANEYRLGNRLKARRTLSAAKKRGCILGGSKKARNNFIKRLDRDLPRFGYKPVRY